MEEGQQILTRVDFKAAVVEKCKELVFVVCDGI